MSFAGQCDVCGGWLGHDPIQLTEPPQFPDDLSLLFDDIEAALWEAIADLLREQGGLPGDYTLANAVEENHGFAAHRKCLVKETSWPELGRELDQVADRMIERGQIDEVVDGD